MCKQGTDACHDEAASSCGLVDCSAHSHHVHIMSGMISEAANVDRGGGTCVMQCIALWSIRHADCAMMGGDME